MFQCLLIYNSLTAAQQAVSILHSNGISVTLKKAPREPGQASCKYSLILSEHRSLDRALNILASRGIRPDKILSDFTGTY